MKDVTGSAKERQTKNNRSLKGKGRSGLYLVLILAAAIYYYFMLPPIHYASREFWIFLFLITLGIVAVEFISDGMRFNEFEEDPLNFIRRSGKKYLRIFIPWAIVGVVGAGIYAVYSPVFFSKQYSEMITIEERDFQEDFPEIDVNQIPLIDREAAMRLGNRRLGALTDLVSQFEISSDYTQINIEEYPYRVSPLKYAGFFKWLNNFRTGIPSYVQVDMVTGEADIMEPSQPMKYSFHDKFHRNVFRKLRFSYPLTMFQNPSFEIDDEGNPYYVATTYGRNFLIREPEATGVITLNAMTGETHRYNVEDTPSWIDRVYSAEIIMHQLQMNGLYSNGFWNSLFAKKGVTMPTEGYNYLPMEDDIYLYTGITSVVSDESNIGFVLVNMRTKEAAMYPLTAAEEYSAMRSAEGSVQEKGYKATFPLLINLDGRPMYILSLKDESGLIKSYALIDVQNYQNVYIAPRVNQLIADYAKDHQLKIEDIDVEEEIAEFEGKIEQVEATVVNGDTVYYFMVDGKVYRANIAINDYLPFLKDQEEVEFKAKDNGEVKEIRWKGLPEDVISKEEEASKEDPAELMEEAEAL